MATPANLDYFSALRITAIMQGISDPRLQPIPLIWNNRVPDVPATDEEATAKLVGTLQMADLIADDQKAVTYSADRFEFQTYKVPNIKMGKAMNQALLNALSRIKAMGATPSRDDVNYFQNRFTKNIADVRYGIELRKEALKLAMLLDGLSYDKLGIKMSNVGWGMYSDQKVTVGTDWTNTAAIGLTDIQNVRQLSQARYGMPLNRATMSTPALRALALQTEFLAQVKVVYMANLLGGAAPAAPLQSDASLRRLAELVIGGVDGTFTIEIDDRFYWDQANTGAITANRLHPLGKVLLTNSANDGNSNAYDFANCPCAESEIGKMFGGNIIGQWPADNRGPIGYMTLADAQMNAPGVVTWGVARGFPRKHMSQSSAVLTVSTLLSETFSTTLPSPV